MDGKSCARKLDGNVSKADDSKVQSIICDVPKSDSSLLVSQ